MCEKCIDTGMNHQYPATHGIYTKVTDAGWLEMDSVLSNKCNAPIQVFPKRCQKSDFPASKNKGFTCFQMVWLMTTSKHHIHQKSQRREIYHSCLWHHFLTFAADFWTRHIEQIYRYIVRIVMIRADYARLCSESPIFAKNIHLSSVLSTFPLPKYRIFESTQNSSKQQGMHYIDTLTVWQRHNHRCNGTHALPMAFYAIFIKMAQNMDLQPIFLSLIA